MNSSLLTIAEAMVTVFRIHLCLDMLFEVEVMVMLLLLTMMSMAVVVMKMMKLLLELERIHSMIDYLLYFVYVVDTAKEKNKLNFVLIDRWNCTL